jgi:hypothetical protein
MMARSPDTWRRFFKVGAILGLMLMISGYTGLEYPGPSYRSAALVAFYGGIFLVTAAVVIWYRYVPPRPPALEEPEESHEFPEADE